MPTRRGQPGRKGTACLQRPHLPLRPRHHPPSLHHTHPPRLDHTIRFRHHAFPDRTAQGNPRSPPWLRLRDPGARRSRTRRGWQLWQGPNYQYASTVLLAFEAGQAATAQSLPIGEGYERALRHGQKRALARGLGQRLPRHRPRRGRHHRHASPKRSLPVSRSNADLGALMSGMPSVGHAGSQMCWSRWWPLVAWNAP